MHYPKYFGEVRELVHLQSCKSLGSATIYPAAFTGEVAHTFSYCLIVGGHESCQMVWKI